MAGPWEKYRTGPQGVPIGMQDPTMDLRAPKMRADMGNDAARIALERERLRVAQENARITNDKATRAANTADQISRREQADKLAPLNAMKNQIARVRELYDQGPGATSSWTPMALQDYLPTDTNKAFDTAGRGLGQLGMSAFRVPGVGSQSDAELRDFIETNRPSASDNDAVIQEKIRNLETRLTESYKARGVPYRSGGSSTRPAPKTPWYGNARSAPRKDSGWKIERLD